MATARRIFLQPLEWRRHQVEGDLTSRSRTGLPPKAVMSATVKWRQAYVLPACFNDAEECKGKVDRCLDRLN
jgi:hypothetical protein